MYLVVAASSSAWICWMSSEDMATLPTRVLMVLTWLLVLVRAEIQEERRWIIYVVSESVSVDRLHNDTGSLAFREQVMIVMACCSGLRVYLGVLSGFGSGIGIVSTDLFTTIQIRELPE